MLTLKLVELSSTSMDKKTDTMLLKAFNSLQGRGKCTNHSKKNWVLLKFEKLPGSICLPATYPAAYVSRQVTRQHMSPGNFHLTDSSSAYPLKAEH